MTLIYKNRLFKTLRGKISLWYLTSIGIIFSLFTTAIGVVFWYTLQEQIDHHVHVVVNEARQILVNNQDDERDALIRSLVSTQGMTVILLSPDGSPILETNSPDVAIVAENRLQNILTTLNLDTSTPKHFTQGNLRFAALPVQLSAGIGIVAVGYSTQVLQATLNILIVIIMLVVIFLILPTTFLGYQLLKNQLQPLEDISSQSQAVSDLSSLAKRIKLNKPTQELETIQKALNTMLSRLEQVFLREREFFADAAHALKTPLAVLSSQIESSAISKKSKFELLSTIDSTASTIQDLLLVSTIGTSSQSKMRISISSIMNDLSELATTLGQTKNIKVLSEIQPQVYLTADKQLLVRIV
jgi:signal transduction histidine kinase